MRYKSDLDMFNFVYEYLDFTSATHVTDTYKFIFTKNLLIFLKIYNSFIASCLLSFFLDMTLALTARSRPLWMTARLTDACQMMTHLFTVSTATLVHTVDTVATPWTICIKQLSEITLVYIVYELTFVISQGAATCFKRKS